MTTRITSDNIQSNTILTTNLASSTITALQGTTSPTITQIQITDSSYVVKDDTAVSTSGGYIKITGTNFTAGSQVVIGSTPATSVGFVNSTTLNVQVPALAAGTYVVYVTINTGSVAIIVNGLTYSGDPAWVTSSSLPAGQVGSAISIQLSATGDAPVTYTLQAGSSLPAGLTLTSGGLLSGTVSGITVETTYNFTIEAIDAQAQESPRTFSITITASDQYFDYVTTLLSASNPTTTFVTDAGTNNFAVSVFGDTRPNNFGPYTPGYYSVNFTGTSTVAMSDMLSLPASSAYNFLAAGNFTIEGWIYPTQTQNYSRVLCINSTYTTNSVGINISSDNGKLVFYAFNIANPMMSSDSAISLNVWTHFAICRDGSAFKMFINGVQQASTYTTASALFNNNSPFITIGNGDVSVGGFSPFTGNISNLRIVNAALYSSTFTPSTTPLTTVANTQLLTCQSNRFLDNSTNNLTVTVTGSPRISGFDPFTPNSSYSTYGSGYFDGTGDYLSVAHNTALNISSGDFTLEAWVLWTGTNASATIINKDGVFNATYPSYAIAINGSGFINFTVGSGNGVGYIQTITSSTALPVNQWVHIAGVKNGTTLTLFQNGVSVATATQTGTIVDGGKALLIGYDAGQGNDKYWFGYISDVRIVKGTAVYTGAFTPPAAPLSAITNTSLLTLQNNQPNNNSMFLDSSSNNLLITRNGNTTQGSFSPYGGGWSNYLNGSSDYLYMDDVDQFHYGSNDFCLECFLYATSSLTTNYVVSQWYSGNKGILLGVGPGSSGKISFLYSKTGSDDYTITDPSAFPTNTWVHVAACRTGNTISLFVNGSRVATTTETGTLYNSTQYPAIGSHVQSAGTSLWPGYISNLRSVKGSNPYNATLTTLTVPTSPLLPITNTSLLMCNSNSIIDNSPNNYTIYRSGTPSVQRFNPFNPVLTTPTSYSGYFDGSGDYLSLASNAAYTFGTGAFSAEVWFYATANAGTTEGGIISSVVDSAPSTFGIAIFHTSAGNISLFIRSSGTNAFGTSASLTLNTWNHCVICRDSSNNAAVFLNGSRIATGTNSTDINTSNFTIGRMYTNLTSNYCTGYASNVRLVKGSTPYNPTQSSITVPTTPLTAIANTSLLTLQNATFTDNSTNNFTITANGNSQPTQFNPFGWTSTTGSNAAYSAANYGGSMYFDGTGDFLNTNYAINWSTFGSFTIEFWVYHTALSAANQTYLSTGSTGYTNFYNYGTTYPGAVAVGIQGTNEIRTGNGVLTQGAWNHVAYTYDGTTTKIYVNGVQQASATTAVYSNNSAALQVGTGLTSQPVFGYMSNVRIVRGQVLYTSNFAPPVAPLSFNANAVLQLNGTGAAVYDSSMIATYETVGNASSTGVIKKYGNSSMYFDGSGDYLKLYGSPNFQFGTGDFTIECWFNGVSVSGGVLIDFRPIGVNGAYPCLYLLSGNIKYYVNTADQISGGSLSTSNWYHIALCRSGSSTKLFVNGTQVGSTYTDTNNYGASSIPAIGATSHHLDGTNPLYGYLDDFRITRGVARYTTTFTPPTSPFIQF